MLWYTQNIVILIWRENIYWLDLLRCWLRKVALNCTCIFLPNNLMIKHLMEL